MEAVIYGMMPRAKTVSRRKLPPEKKVQKVQNCSGIRIEPIIEGRLIDERNRDIGADTVHRQQAEHEEDALLQLRHVPYIL
jgi:hypothetical protein